MSAPRFFATADPGPAGLPLIAPWRRVPLDPDYAGSWLVTGDLDGDGRAEIVSARNVNMGDVHHTSAVAVHDLDGSVRWRWGQPGSLGRPGFHHDVACQIHDWDDDGQLEVIICTEGFLVELDGATGAEKRRLPIPPGATDCLVFLDLSGQGRAGDVLVKDRYDTIWAMDRDGRVRWQVHRPGDYLTAHQPLPVDVDGDGRDEVVAGYALLGPDGDTRWVLANEGRFTGKGHLDCARALVPGDRPADWRLALTCCGDGRLMVVDGLGQVCWEYAGPHYESIDIGRIHPGVAGPQLAVDVVPHTGQPGNEIWTYSATGEWLGRLAVGYGRFHTLVDWDGDGLDEIVVPHARGLFDHQGRRLATFAMESQVDLYGGAPYEQGEVGNTVLRGDLDGDGVADLVLTAPAAAYVFTNPSPAGTTAPAGQGSGVNFTFY